jgi:3-oxoacyl-[acyl-carrier-protein] synthase II
MMSTRSVAKGKDSRPLNAQRGGMKPSEGAACVIFESEEHVTARGGKPIAEWLCGATANESHHFLAPDEEAAVLEELLRTSLGNDHLAGKKADWISLHATGTPRFDAVEIACLKRVFASGLPWLSAMKRTTGHALGASGLIEAAMLAEGLHKEALPSWPMNTDPALELDSLKPQTPPLPQLALQIGQGMGGVVVVNAYGAIKN